MRYVEYTFFKVFKRMSIIIRFVLASVIFVFSVKVLAANGDTTDDILYGLFLLYKA